MDQDKDMVDEPAEINRGFASPLRHLNAPRSSTIDQYETFPRVKRVTRPKASVRRTFLGSAQNRAADLRGRIYWRKSKLSAESSETDCCWMNRCSIFQCKDNRVHVKSD